MGIPNQFNDIINKHLNVNAAWLPVTNTFRLGDYGIISEGVFTKMGNIEEFGVALNIQDGPDATIDFTSANTTVVKFAAGAQVDVIPSAAIDAKITFKFESAKSFLVKAPVIKVSELQNVNQVAIQLKEKDNWERKWKVVHQVYHALEPVIISTISAGTEVTFSGDVTALKALNVGNASVEVGTTKELGLKVHGKAGVIGLGLFRLKRAGGPDFSVRDLQKPADAIDIIRIAEAEEDDL